MHGETVILSPYFSICLKSFFLCKYKEKIRKTASFLHDLVENFSQDNILTRPYSGQISNQSEESFKSNSNGRVVTEKETVSFAEREISK